ncbi:hypothetical protein GCM10009563_06890 [Subtercola frigoramans]
MCCCLFHEDALVNPGAVPPRLPGDCRAREGTSSCRVAHSAAVTGLARPVLLSDSLADALFFRRLPGDTRFIVIWQQSYTAPGARTLGWCA